MNSQKTDIGDAIVEYQLSHLQLENMNVQNAYYTNADVKVNEAIEKENASMKKLSCLLQDKVREYEEGDIFEIMSEEFPTSTSKMKISLEDLPQNLVIDVLLHGWRADIDRLIKE